MLAVALALVVTAAPLDRHITIDVRRAPIADVLRLIADHAQLNLVLSDDVQGTVTLSLRDVPLRTALEVVLASHALGRELDGNVLRIAPLRQLAEEASHRAALKKARASSGAMKTRIIHVSYARAADLAPLVQATLSERGSVSVDARTNSLIVRDVDE